MNEFDNQSFYAESENNIDSMPSLVAAPNSFAFFARTMGIAAIFCTIFSVLYGTLLFGGMAIILAWLSKGESAQMCKIAKVGLGAGITALVVQIGMLVFSLYSLIYVPEFREKFDTLYEQMYGEPLDETIDSILDDMGVSLPEGGSL